MTQDETPQMKSGSDKGRNQFDPQITQMDTDFKTKTDQGFKLNSLLS